MLTLPFWIITEHIKPADAEHTEATDLGSALAFTSNEKLVMFMRANSGGEWKMQMADDREGLIILIADLHRLNINKISVNPKQDGVDGEHISLSDVVAFADSMSK